MKGGVKLELQGRFILLLFLLWKQSRRSPPTVQHRPSSRHRRMVKWQSHHVQAMNSGFTAMRHNYNGGVGLGQIITRWVGGWVWYKSQFVIIITRAAYLSLSSTIDRETKKGLINWVTEEAIFRQEELLKVHYALEWPDARTIINLGGGLLTTK